MGRRLNKTRDTPAADNAVFSVTETSPARTRFTARAPRTAATLVIAILAIAGLRAAILGPQAPKAAAPKLPDIGDLAAQNYAADFAQAYLSYDAARPNSYTDNLKPFSSAAVGDDQFGVSLPDRGRQAVIWTSVAQDQEAFVGGRLITIEAKTDTGRVLFLSVPVARDRTGALYLSRAPSIVGPPTSTAQANAPVLRTVADDLLEETIGRALRNYLAGQQIDLRADLTANAGISQPTESYTLANVQSLSWADDNADAVLAVITAVDSRKATYTFSYEITVIKQADRWLIQAIQTVPTSS